MQRPPSLASATSALATSSHTPRPGSSASIDGSDDHLAGSLKVRPAPWATPPLTKVDDHRRVSPSADPFVILRVIPPTANLGYQMHLGGLSSGHRAQLPRGIVHTWLCRGRREPSATPSGQVPAGQRSGRSRVGRLRLTLVDRWVPSSQRRAAASLAGRGTGNLHPHRSAIQLP